MSTDVLDLSSLELVELIESMRETGIVVKRHTRAVQSQAGSRSRCWVGRRINDGVFFVVLFSGQSDQEAIVAVTAALLRLARFEKESWNVHLGDPEPVAAKLLTDQTIAAFARGVTSPGGGA